MSSLKLKALIYKYTGWFFAYKEQSEFLESAKFWKQMRKALKNKKNDMGPQALQGLFIGMWQVEHGFYRPASFLRFKRPRVFWRIVSWWVILCIVIRWDIENLIKKLDKAE